MSEPIFLPYQTMTTVEVEALQGFITQIAIPNMNIMEIGVWKGLSTSIWAKVIKPLGGHIYVVDNWKGIPDSPQEANSEDVYSIFKANLIILDLWDIVHPLVMDSVVAANLVKDKFFDLVYIDADHRYEAISADIKAWYPKVKIGGILAGHDYRAHPGVKRAVDEILQKFEVIKETTIWYHKKENENRN